MRQNQHPVQHRVPGFGGPQGAIAIEYMIDNIARTLGKDALDIRQLNYYGRDERNVTPYGQVVADNVLDELTDNWNNPVTTGHAARLSPPSTSAARY
ncbi:MAG: molybdopterin cofactor-binding domain-containing protein [Thiolinea sp.]